MNSSRAGKDKYETKLDKLQKLNNKCIGLVRSDFTGSIEVHWAEGEIKKVRKIETDNSF